MTGAAPTPSPSVDPVTAAENNVNDYNNQSPVAPTPTPAPSPPPTVNVGGGTTGTANNPEDQYLAAGGKVEDADLSKYTASDGPLWQIPLGADPNDPSGVPGLSISDVLAAFGVTDVKGLKALLAAGDKKSTITPMQRQFYTGYTDLWGQEPPEGYIEKAMKQMNYTEFLDGERAKPAFRKTDTYRNETADKAAHLASLLGMR